MWDIFDKQEALQGGYALISDTPPEEPPLEAGEKPSVLDAIRQSREDAKANPVPRRESAGKDKARPWWYSNHWSTKARKSLHMPI